MKDAGGNELGPEDQDFGRGKDIVDQNPLLPKPGRSRAPSVYLPTGSGPPTTLGLFTDEKWATRLVLEPEPWAWSSFRWYSLGERGPVLVNEQRRAEMSLCARETFAEPTNEVPTL